MNLDPITVAEQKRRVHIEPTPPVSDCEAQSHEIKIMGATALIRDLRSELDAVRKNLTATQERCNGLLFERRALVDAIEGFKDALCSSSDDVDDMIGIAHDYRQRAWAAEDRVKALEAEKATNEAEPATAETDRKYVSDQLASGKISAHEARCMYYGIRRKEQIEGFPYAPSPAQEQDPMVGECVSGPRKPDEPKEAPRQGWLDGEMACIVRAQFQTEPTNPDSYFVTVGEVAGSKAYATNLLNAAGVKPPEHYRDPNKALFIESTDFPELNGKWLMPGETVVGKAQPKREIPGDQASVDRALDHVERMQTAVQVAVPAVSDTCEGCKHVDVSCGTFPCSNCGPGRPHYRKAKWKLIRCEARNPNGTICGDTMRLVRGTLGGGVLYECTSCTSARVIPQGRIRRVRKSADRG